LLDRHSSAVRRRRRWYSSMAGVSKILYCFIMAFLSIRFPDCIWKE
jgi:hypothetical protein